MGILVPYLMGGLGNWLFQVACVLNIGKNETVVLCPRYISRSPHSNIDYLSTVFKHIRQGLIRDIRLSRIIENDNLDTLDLHFFQKQLEKHNILLQGYFHNWIYIPDNFGDLIEYKNPAILKKYPDIQNSCFLHVRGGDYVNHPLHDVGLSDRYYPSSIQFMKERGITQFVVFTNDKEYCSQQEYLKNIEYTVVEENEVDTLYLMTQCRAAIIANSTFSWWGAYLNRQRLICIPSKWFNDPKKFIPGYFFPNCFVQQV